MGDPDLWKSPVYAIMSRWPETMRVFIDWQMHCVGCPIAMFQTLNEAAAEHGIAAEVLRRQIMTAIAGAKPKASRLRGRRQSKPVDADPSREVSGGRFQQDRRPPKR